MKRFAGWVSLFILALSPVCLGADSTGTLNIQDLMRQGNAMRQNVAWMTVGLDELLKSQQRRLALTPKQRKQILPIMQGLVREKLILLKAETQLAVSGQSGSQPRNGAQRSQGQARQTQGQAGQQWPRSGQNGGLTGDQAGLQKLQELIIFGNAQADKVDAVLTPVQVSFIDNLDFQPEKYGFAASRQFGNGGSNIQGGMGGSGGQTFQGGQNGQSRQGGQGGQGGQTGRNWGGGNSGTNNGARQEAISAGRALLIKVNNEVMRLLRQ